MVAFKCPVCGLPLLHEENAFVCPNAHSFDIARKGYVNLMLANQGHRGEEGDSKEMIAARRRFLSSGHYAILQKALIDLFVSLGLKEGAAFCDIACGEGYYTNAIARALPLETIGIDISKAAVMASASARNALGLSNVSYAVGNLDYLPLLDASQDALLNCFAPINEEEFLRVARPGGYYVRVLPDADHLWGMKEILYDEVRPNLPKEKEMPGFELEKEMHLREDIVLQGQEIQDLFMMTPYFYKSGAKAKERLCALSCLPTRISFLLRVYRKK